MATSGRYIFNKVFASADNIVLHGSCYIHADNYPEGAASLFLSAMLDRNDESAIEGIKQGRKQESREWFDLFVRANSEAEILSPSEIETIMGEEYHYHIGPDASITIQPSQMNGNPVNETKEDFSHVALMVNAYNEDTPYDPFIPALNDKALEQLGIEAQKSRLELPNRYIRMSSVPRFADAYQQRMAHFERVSTRDNPNYQIAKLNHEYWQAHAEQLEQKLGAQVPWKTDSQAPTDHEYWKALTGVLPDRGMAEDGEDDGPQMRA